MYRATLELIEIIMDAYTVRFAFKMFTTGENKLLRLTSTELKSHYENVMANRGPVAIGISNPQKIKREEYK